jgi:hypothetical protein
VTTSDAFDRWRRVLLAITAVFAVLALGWAVLGTFDPFGFYEGYMARWLFDTDGLPDPAKRAFAFALIPAGATTAAFFVLVHMIVRHAFPRREAWAYRAVVWAVLVWFVVDSGLSALHGAWFNIAIANVPCLLVLGVPLVYLRPYFDKR